MKSFVLYILVSLLPGARSSSLFALLVISALCGFCGGTVAFAAAPSDPLRALIKTHSTKELASLRLNQRELERGQALCQAQLKRKKLPSGCFRVLAIEEKLGQITLLKKAEGVQWLTDSCSRIAPKVKDVGELKRALDADNLSPRCEELIRQQLDDINYVADEEAPDVYFANHLQK
jgi:hypothetical protein